MKIAYITSDYKWKEHGVTRGYYEALKKLGHKVELMRTKDMFALTDPSIDQIWVVNSKKMFKDSEAKQLKEDTRMIGFNITQAKALSFKHHYHTMYCATQEPGTVFLPPAIDPKFHRVLDNTSERAIDYALFGRMFGHRTKEMSKHPEIKHFYRKFRGEALIRAINNVKVGMDFDTKAVANTIPHRVLEYAGCGAMVCCPYREDIAQIFEYGKEVVEYTGELPEYNPEIAEAGYKRCHEEHTYINRVRKILENESTSY